MDTSMLLSAIKCLTSWRRRAGPMRGRARRFLVATGTALLTLSVAQAATPLADQPLFSNISVPGNLVLDLSVEFPTAISVAHQGAFVAGNSYMGYFDPQKCYRYYVGTETGDDVSYFYPVRNAYPAGTGKCTESGYTDTWSGNFLNWMTMQAIDPFRWALTGGYRRVDTPSTTILERAWASNNPNNGSDANFPLIPTSDGNPLKARPSPSSADIADHTPLSFSSLKVSVRARGNQVWFTQSASLSSSTTGTPATYSQSATLDPTKIYSFYVRVQVCVSGSGFSLEANCKAYPSGYYKPEGLLQQYADKIRFSAFSYLNDPTDNNRDGGVLRARQKFVGPNVTNPGSAPTSNPASEWDPTTGVFTLNPDATDAANTASVFGVPVATSGVINYLNGFGEQQHTYKRRDPVSELYYGALRYLKNQGNVAAWSNIATDPNVTRLVDGFPVITDWGDPIQYSCQRNFILGIGDTNTNWDWNVPGGHSYGSNEPALPSEVSSDTTVNAVTATNKVGSLQGLASSLGTKSISSGSYLIAGLAYDANTKDIRPDDITKPNTLGKQTVQTYWLDVLEFGTYVPSNQYYLAAKYGGFSVPSNFGDPYSRTTPLDSAWWNTTTDTVGSQPRPDNYYTVARPDQMVAGLTKAFASIASALKAYTTSFSTSLPQVSVSNNRSYAAQYDSQNWTGEVVASSLSFDPVSGNPSQTVQWKLNNKLATQLAGTGWDSGRRVVTWNTASSTGVPFRIASLSSAQKTALDPSYVSGDDSSNYLNYLRGQQTNEAASTSTGSTHAYRTRTKLLGDVVGSRVRPIGPPSLILSDGTNPGYASFKSTWSARPTMVYFGANDGMMHAVNGELTGSSAGKEVFAYVPSAVIGGPSATPSVDGLAALGNPSFVHHNYVNATPNVYDIDFGKTQGGSGTDWHSVLIGGLGKGGKSYYAIDVTDPSAFGSESAAAGKVLWEFSNPDLGYTYGDPVVVKTKRWGWVAVFVSGYNNADGKGYFFIVNPRTGALLQKVSTGVGSTSSDAGLAQANGFVLDRTDGTADAVYAGDLLGNVWRLDVTAASSDYPAPTRIAQLTDASNNPQPITTRPLIEVQPGTNRRFVLVGAGRMLDTTDIGATQVQSYWAFRDGSGARFNDATSLATVGLSFPLTRANMLANSDTLNSDGTYGGVTFNDPKQMGWYLDLGSGTSSIGWRVVTDSTAFNGAVAFASTLPSGDACNPSGSSRIYAFDFGTGKSVLTSTTTDSNNVTSTAPIAYSTATTSVVTDLRFFSVDGQARLIGGSDTGDLKSIEGNFSGGSGLRRLNWRELPTAD